MSKASRVLRVLLANSGEAWKIKELAKEAEVSLGLASNVKRLLEDRDYYSLKPVADLESDLAAACRERKVPYALTGFSAVARLAPIVRSPRAMAMCGNRLDLRGFRGRGEEAAGELFDEVTPCYGLDYIWSRIHNMNTKWEVIFHGEFDEEFQALDEGLQDEPLAHAILLRDFGPHLAIRPGSSRNDSTRG